jgi:hypothetical protein
MSNAPHPSRSAVLLTAGLALGLWGCGTDLTLPPATVPIAQQQITLFALTGTPVATASAYDMLTLAQVRVDQTSAFDFAFDLRFDTAYGLGHPGDTVAVLVPRGVFGFAIDPGLQTAPTLAWDSVVIAPPDGYVKDKALRIRAGDIVYAASRAQTCQTGFILPHYAKLQIASIDVANRVATILVVIDPSPR